MKKQNVEGGPVQQQRPQGHARAPINSEETCTGAQLFRDKEFL